MTPGSLTLVITRRCPYRCGFCPQGFEPKDMDARILSAALRGLGCRLAPGSRIKLFGGEPLLKPGLLRQAVLLGRKLGLEGRFELGTRGALLNERMAAFLAACPEVEVVFGRSSAWARRLPKSSLNFVISPGENASRVLARMRAAVTRGFFSFNFLPVYFVPWSAGQIEGLRRAFGGLSRLIRLAFASGRPLQVKNLEHVGTLPLYNDGWCVDTDGCVYASNLILVRGAAPHSGRLRLGHVGMPGRMRAFPPPRALDTVLRACFSPEVLEGTRRADAALSEFVHGLQG